MTIKATGKQWNWTYAYPDDKIEFTSIMLSDEDRAKLARRHLACSASTTSWWCR